MINDSHRIYGKVKELSLAQLRQVFKQLPYVEFALLFGSRASLSLSQVDGRSDYDFAVLLNKSQPCDWGHVAKLRTELGSLLDLPDVDFDVIDLQVASPLMLQSIKSQYCVLKGDENGVRDLFTK